MITIRWHSLVLTWKYTWMRNILDICQSTHSFLSNTVTPISVHEKERRFPEERFLIGQSNRISRLNDQ